MPLSHDHQVTSTATPLPGAALQTREPTHGISFWQAGKVWVRIALQSFGGPAGQIAVMHRILVDEKRWVSESRFLHALNYCMLLPGPEAQQLATYMGWLLHGVRGGLPAGSLFVVPGFAAILLLSILYAGFQDLRLVHALFFGLKAAVLAIVVEAVLRISRRALKNTVMVSIAGLAFFMASSVAEEDTWRRTSMSECPAPAVVREIGLMTCEVARETTGNI